MLYMRGNVYIIGYRTITFFQAGKLWLSFQRLQSAESDKNILMDISKLGRQCCAFAFLYMYLLTR